MLTRLQLSFIANATVLCTHQIDAAYWHEWELFLLPGGNQLNLLLNLPIVASVFVAFSVASAYTHHAAKAHLYLVLLGFLTVGLHSLFFALGHRQFAQPMSVILITAAGLLSTLQLVLVMRTQTNNSTQGDAR